MQEFKDYILLEYKEMVPNFAATKFDFSHSSRPKIDKKSHTTLTLNTIHVNIKFFDKDMNQLLTKTISFENNLLSKPCKKLLVNIAPAELENKFNSALKDIYTIIMKSYTAELNMLNIKIRNLNLYLNSDNELSREGIEPIIPFEFKGESIKMSDIKPNELNHKQKQQFDM